MKAAGGALQSGRHAAAPWNAPSAAADYAVGEASTRHIARTGSGFLLAVVILSGASGVLRNVQFEDITALGIATVCIVGLAALLWLAEPVVPRGMTKWLVPFVIFAVWVLLSSGRAQLSTLALQNMAVIVGFVALALLAAREGLLNDRLQSSLNVAFHIATWCALGVYSAVLLTSGLGSKEFWNARGFALFAVMALCWHLARWRNGSLISLGVAFVVVLVIAASLSRLALGISLLVFALAQLDETSWKGRLRLLAAGVVASAVLVYAFLNFEPLRERMFEGDLSLTVGSIPINSMGRTDMWRQTLLSAQDAIWVGKGGGSSAALIQRINGLEHPHNDYLRVLHDYGLIGLAPFVIAFIVLITKGWKLWKKNSHNRHSGKTIQRAALLALVAVPTSMLVDNSLAYPFVMFPLAILTGASFGSAARHGDL